MLSQTYPSLELVFDVVDPVIDTLRRLLQHAIPQGNANLTPREYVLLGLPSFKRTVKLCLG